MPRPPKPIIAVPLGDPAGIGAELVAKLVATPDLTNDATLVVVGDRWLWEDGQATAATRHRLPEISRFEEVPGKPQDGAFFSRSTPCGRTKCHRPWRPPPAGAR